MFESSLFVVVSAWGISTQIEGNFVSQLLQAQPYAFSASLVAGLLMLGLYRIHNDHTPQRTILRILISFALVGLFLSLTAYALPLATFAVDGKAIAYAMTLSFLIVLAIRSLHLYAINQATFKNRVLVLGAGKKAKSLSELRTDTDLSDSVIVGYVKFTNDQISVDEGNIIDIELDTLEKYALGNRIDEILVATDDRRIGLPMQQLLSCKMHGVSVRDLPSFYERVTGKLRLDLIYPSCLIFSDGFYQSPMRRLAGRLMDLSGAMILSIVSAPLMIAATAAIFFDGQKGGRIFYRQERVGLRGKTFEILKFRTMVVDAEKHGGAQWAEEDDPRITRAGKILRKYRIDELPQLLNVLRGDMSLVGPRPERPEFVTKLSEDIPYYDERHRVKPGITGWAQINYPYGSSERDAMEKLQYDLYYVKNNSVLFDIAILLQTGDVICFRKGSR
jgi:sugar transferase (PEP-CTERM system associated)